MPILAVLLVALSWPGHGQSAGYDRAEDVAPGVRYRERHWMRAADGPFTMGILEIDPRHPAVNLAPARARDRMRGRETVSSMVKRHGAVAGVNGGYFVVSGPYAGASTGVYQWNGRPLAAGAGRSALILCREKDFQERVEVSVTDFRGQVTASKGARLRIAAMNGPRPDDGLALYTPEFGSTTLTAAGGLEAALDASSRVLRLADSGNSPIPPGGAVLSGSGPAAAWLRAHAAPGAVLRVRTGFRPHRSGCGAEDIVGAGPTLVRNGRAVVTAERFRHAPARHPRTAAAVTARGTLLLVTLDGRQASSAGMRLDEFAAELVALGVREAVNLDGGGSTTMVVRGAVRNSPSDGTERPVSDALLVFSVSNREDLRELVNALATDPAQVSHALSTALRTALGEPSLNSFKRLIEKGAAPDLSPSAARLLREAAYSAGRLERNR